ncbi:MAG: lipopolysaccharide heptosyltransferase II, partial [Omnitrophica bacterium RBG_13_46_9]
RIADEARNSVMEKFNAKKIMESTLALYEDASSGMNILIIKVGALGDAILIIPSVRAIREKFPQAKIKLLTGEENRDVFINSPLVDEIIVCDFKGRDKGLGGILRIAKRLRMESFDMVIDFQNNKKSHLLSFLSCAPKRYGYDNGKLGFLLNKKVKDTKPSIGPIEHQLGILGLLGICDVDKNFALWPSREDEEWADNFLESYWLKNDMRLVAVNIGSSPRWVTKLWPVKNYIEVCDKLTKKFGIQVVLIGSEKNDPRSEEFLRRTKCKPINALGKTNIPRLACLIKRCSLLVSSDSAPIHIAASAGTPFVAFFGPTDPRRHLPPADNCIVFKKELKCSPCYHTYCAREYACMVSIKPGEVYEGILKLLGIKDINPKS